jgi:outer membrane protein assembly factor BamE
MRFLTAFSLSVLLFGLTACQTNQVKEFSKVSAGMDKGQVLDILGSPQNSERWKGKDRWLYVMFDNSQRVVKEVQFEDGKVVYFGDEYRNNENAKIEELNNSIKNNSKATNKDRQSSFEPIQ